MGRSGARRRGHPAERCPRDGALRQLVRRLFERLQREGPVAACYEAGVSGYDLYRQITRLGVACQVIAPPLMPRRPGRASRPASATPRSWCPAGELIAIHVPGEADEGVRGFVRCREDVRRDVGRWRHRVVKFLDRHWRVPPVAALVRPVGG
jgi:transposase